MSTPVGAVEVRASWRTRHAPALAEARHNLTVFLRDKLALVGVIWIAIVFSLGVLAPVVAPNPAQGRGQPDVPAALQAPSWQHPFWTDELGRDELSRVIYGCRLALLMPFIVMVGVAVVGVPLGGIAGYFGGWLDEVIMRTTDLFLAFPGVILAMALIAFMGPSLRNVAIALVVTWWPWYTRLVRGMAVSLRQRGYSKAARTMGVADLRIVFRHIIANSLGPVIVQMTLDVGAVILEVAGLSFIGLGASPPTPDWGLMISTGREYAINQWWVGTFPGVAIFLLVLAFNFVGDGLRDVLDPRSKR
jgi:peptide/nickel transport system permease protein